MTKSLSPFLKILVAIITLTVSFIWPAFTFFLLTLFCVISFAKKRIIPEDRKFVITILSLVIIVKCIIMVLYFYFWLLPGHQDVIGPDGAGFSHGGWYIAKVLSGTVDYKVPSTELVFKRFYNSVDFFKGKLLPFNRRGNGLFTYFAGIMYFLFGYVPLLVKSFNIFFSAISSVLIYLLALEIYDRKVARLAFIFFTFFPSMFIFSISALRDPLIILCILTIIYSLSRLNKGVSLKRISALVLMLALILLLREEMFVIMTGVIAAVLAINKKVNMKIKILTVALSVALFIIAVHCGLFLKISFLRDFSLEKIPAVILSKNASLYSLHGNLAYKIFPDKQYEAYEKYPDRIKYFNSDEKMMMKELLSSLPRAVFYYLVRPVPFARSGFVYGLLSINMVFWYLLLILSAVGIFRRRSGAVYPILIYCGIILLATSVVEANEGILLRHRDSLVPFFVLFAAAGVDKIMLMQKHGK